MSETTNSGRPETRKPSGDGLTVRRVYGDGLTVRRVDGDGLTVRRVDFMIPANSKAHHTDRFAISAPKSSNPHLVVRRGQPFSVKIQFSRPYDAKKNNLSLVLEAGDQPDTSHGTYVKFNLSNTDKTDNWGAKIVSIKDDTITVKVFTPPTCYVAKWTFKINVVENGKEHLSYTSQNPIYILFNPWCEKDPVFMQEDLLNEYVLNETGLLYNGSSMEIYSRSWNYGQFESSVLDTTMGLLDYAELEWDKRGNPIFIGRGLAAMTNDQDDNGVLVGKWKEPYNDGLNPLNWSGSSAILVKFKKHNRPVKYGQCWVYAAVATTLFRALGIPARPVTNFNSAHDTDGSITYDIHYKEDGTVDTSFGDSIWNFHVWTEIWTTRPDLRPGYGGWQVVDATPQELSNGIFTCGPASVVAIKRGEVDLPYDGRFVFAEVNGDQVSWKRNKSGNERIVGVDRRVVGQSISTKAPNSHEREDLTLQYKFAEDTEEETASVKKATLLGTKKSSGLYKQTDKDVKFSIEHDSKNTWVGGNFVVGLKVKNNSKEKRSVEGRIVISTMYYTGVLVDTLKSEPLSFHLQPGQENLHQVVVRPEEYDGHLTDCFMLDVNIFANVNETTQAFAKRQEYMLCTPHLDVQAPEQVAENEQIEIYVSLKNPRNMTLTNCSVTVDGMVVLRVFPQKDIPPGGTFWANLVVEPESTGYGEIIIVFNSEQMHGINTSRPIFVTENWYSEN